MFGKLSVRIVAIAGMALLVACGGGAGVGGGTGTIVLSVTDAPFPGLDCLEAANIQVWKIEAKGSAGFHEIPLAQPDPEGDADETPGPAAPKPPDGVATQTVNLLDLVAGLTDLLGQAEVPAGAYSEIRLLLVKAELEFAVDDTDEENPVSFDPQPFKVPSGMSSGLKIKIDPPLLLAPGQTVQLVLDVDLAESFHTAGLGGTPTCDDLRQGEAKVIFRPVVRALNESEVGMVTGLVRDAVTGEGVGGAQIAALPTDGDPAAIDGTDDTVPLPKTLSAADGAYALLLEPGSYDLYVKADRYADEWTLALEDVIVAMGEPLTGQDIELVPPADAPADE